MTVDEHARMQELEGLVKRYRSRIVVLKAENQALRERLCPACALNADRQVGQAAPSQERER